MENLRIRAATPADAAELLRIRYDAIIEIRVTGVSHERVRRWAERRDMGWMVRALRDRETWVGTLGDKIVSWVAVEKDRVEGLYTDPRNAQRGIGSALLQFVERELMSRGVEHVSLEAGANVEGFYRRRGYEPIGPGPDGGQAMRKVLAPTEPNR